jgi:hypothetical protein
MFALSLVCIAALVGPACAGEKDSLPGAIELPVRVRVGLRVIDITEIKEVAGR